MAIPGRQPQISTWLLLHRKAAYNRQTHHKTLVNNLMRKHQLEMLANPVMGLRIRADPNQLPLLTKPYAINIEDGRLIHVLRHPQNYWERRLHRLLSTLLQEA